MNTKPKEADGRPLDEADAKLLFNALKSAETFFAPCYSEESIEGLQRKLVTPKVGLGAFVKNTCAVAAQIANLETKNRIAAHGAARRTGIHHDGHEVCILCAAQIDRVAWNLEVMLYVGPYAMIKNIADALSKEAVAICKKDSKRARFVKRENLP